MQVKQLQNPEPVFETIIGLIVRLAEHGLIHCDFNEFNIMIDDEEEVTMIDFPQMVSVSHRNAQMYFDRDVECVFKFFRKRFNLSFEENSDDDVDGREIDADESARPSFTSIVKAAGSLDKELAASGFTRKDQDDIEKFIEGGVQQDRDSDDEGTEDEQDVSTSNDEGTEGEQHVHKLNEMNASGLNSFHLREQEGEVKGKELNHEGQDSGPEKQDTSDKEGSDVGEYDAELMKRLKKERRRAVAAARHGKKALSSRNSYKDKGGKSSQNAKIQKQMNKW